jgi:hypothetical protein
LIVKIKCSDCGREHEYDVTATIKQSLVATEDGRVGRMTKLERVNVKQKK